MSPALFAGLAPPSPLTCSGFSLGSPLLYLTLIISCSGPMTLRSSAHTTGWSPRWNPCSCVSGVNVWRRSRPPPLPVARPCPSSLPRIHGFALNPSGILVKSCNAKHAADDTLSAQPQRLRPTPQVSGKLCWVNFDRSWSSVWFGLGHAWRSCKWALKQHISPVDGHASSQTKRDTIHFLSTFLTRSHEFTENATPKFRSFFSIPC